jgi:RNA polymerase sigma-B factor
VNDQRLRRRGDSRARSELATALDRRPQLIMEAIAAAEGRHAISLDAPTAEDGESSTYLDLLGDADAALAAVDDRLLADHLFRSLDSRARAVLRMRFELDLRQYEIADRVGISQMHVSRILRDALATLHRHATGIAPGAPRAAPA